MDPQAPAGYRSDALGRRIQRTVGGISTTWVSAGAQEILELTHAAVPSLAAQADRGSLAGLAAAPADGLALLSGATGLPGAGVVRISFQPAGHAIPDGFWVDAGDPVGARPISGADPSPVYGWSPSAVSPLARGTALPIVQDTLVDLSPGSTWRLALPNGSYPVVIVAGDASRRDRSNHLLVNGVALTDPDPSPGPDGYLNGDFDIWAAEITVSDGFLTISADTGAGAVDASLVWIEIGPSGLALPAASTVNDLAASLTEGTWRTTPPPPALPPARTYVYGSSVDEPLVQIAGGEWLWYHANHLYSVSALTDAAGQVVRRYGYSAYGDRVVMDSAGNVVAADARDAYGFTGRRYDAETGLWYFRARYFDSQLGRFVGRDPLGYVDGMGLYSGYFVPGGLDPSGLASSFGYDTIKWPRLPSCDGSFKGTNWLIQWYVGGQTRSGSIIQWVAVDWNVEDCNGNPVQKPSHFGDQHGYLEAWHFNQGGIAVSPNGSNSVSNPNEDGLDQDQWITITTGCTRGTVLVTAEFNYYNASANDIISSGFPYWAPGAGCTPASGACFDYGSSSNPGLPPSGSLLSTWVSPLLSDPDLLIPGAGQNATLHDLSRRGRRYMEMRWNCCNGSSSTNVTISPENTTYNAVSGTQLDR